MADPHLLTGAFALDALDELERVSAERHLGTCSDCSAEVGEFREVTTYLAGRVAMEPPAELRTRVLTRVHETRQLAPEGAHRSLPRMSARRALATAAAAVVVAGGGLLGGVAWNAQQEAEQARSQAAAITAVLSDPSREQNDGVIGSGQVTVVAAGDRAVFAARDLPVPPSGRTYQLWVIGADRRIRSAGLLDLSGGTTQALVRDVRAGEELAVSVEPEGGSAQPTTDPLVSVPVA